MWYAQQTLLEDLLGCRIHVSTALNVLARGQLRRLPGCEIWCIISELNAPLSRGFTRLVHKHSTSIGSPFTCSADPISVMIPNTCSQKSS